MSEATATEPTAPDASIVMESKPGISVGDFDPPRPSRFDAYGRNGVPFPFPCRVVDADGNVIGPCREADLETGECVVYDLRDGRWQLGDDLRVATKVVQGKAPLHLEALRGPVSG